MIADEALEAELTSLNLQKPSVQSPGHSVSLISPERVVEGFGEKERARSKSVAKVYKEAYVPRSKMAEQLKKIQLKTQQADYERKMSEKPRSAVSRSRGSLALQASRFGNDAGPQLIAPNVYFHRNMSGKSRLIFNTDFDDVVPLENLQIKASKMQ